MTDIDFSKNYKKLPKKRVAAGVLLLNSSNEILLVKPSYREGWLMPGGLIEENESLAAGCERELLEETGLTIQLNELLVVDYVKAENEDITEVLMFVFNGGLLKDKDIENIKLQKNELSEFKFCSIPEAKKLAAINTSNRIDSCINAVNSGKALYTENGISKN